MRISIRLNLKEGITIKQFCRNLDSFEGQEKDGQDKKSYDILSKNCEDSYYWMFGSADSLFLPVEQVSAYLPLYLNKNVFNPQSKFFQDNIANIETSIYIKDHSLDGSENVKQKSSSENGSKKNSILEKYQGKIIKFSKKFEEFLTKYELQHRISYSLFQLMKNFLNLSQMSHAFDVERILGDAFLSFIGNMTYIFEKSEKLEISNDLENVEQAVSKSVICI